MPSTPARINSSYSGGVRPDPPAAFSALATTRSICSRLRSPRTARTTICRPGLPTISPISNNRTVWGPKRGLQRPASPPICHLLRQPAFCTGGRGESLNRLKTRAFVKSGREVPRGARSQGGLPAPNRKTSRDTSVCPGLGYTALPGSGGRIGLARCQPGAGHAPDQQVAGQQGGLA